MKYSPRNIIFCAVSEYLDNKTYKKVMDEIGGNFLSSHCLMLGLRSDIEATPGEIRGFCFK
jgi:hypothetical protein